MCVCGVTGYLSTVHRPDNEVVLLHVPEAAASASAAVGDADKNSQYTIYASPELNDDVIDRSRLSVCLCVVCPVPFLLTLRPPPAKSIPVLPCGTEAFTLNKLKLSSLDFAVNRLFRKLLKTNNIVPLNLVNIRLDLISPV